MPYELKDGAIFRDGKRLLALARGQWGDGAPSAAELKEAERYTAAALAMFPGFHALALELICGEGGTVSQQRCIDLARRGLGMTHEPIPPPTTAEAALPGQAWEAPRILENRPTAPATPPQSLEPRLAPYGVPQAVAMGAGYVVDYEGAEIGWTPRAPNPDVEGGTMPIGELREGCADIGDGYPTEREAWEAAAAHHESRHPRPGEFTRAIEAGYTNEEG